MSTETDYRKLVRSPSDIRAHLPRLHKLVLALDAKQVIELGVRSGRSTCALLAALERTGGRLWSCDVRPPRRLPESVREHERWTFHLGDSVQSAHHAPAAADLVFIDTSHHYEHTLAELRAYAPRARVVALHDVEMQWHEGQPPSDPPYAVAVALHEYLTEAETPWRLTLRSGDNGMAVIER
jgi:cephalosporin hydroxylase